jgi:carboxyl-terminal processing protease
LLTSTLQRDVRILRTASLVFTFLLTFSLSAAEPASGPRPAPRLDSLRQKARDAEKRGAWLEACRCYDEILRRDRHHVPTRQAYQRCLRRLHIVYRHRDSSYRRLLELTPLQALEVYKQVVDVVGSTYVDRSKTSLNQLFRQGLQEVQLALDENVFRKEYLPTVKPAVLNAFKEKLATWPLTRITTPNEACDQIVAVVRAAQKEGIVSRVGLCTLFGLEFTAGACNALDEYTAFLPPAPFTVVQASLRGDLVGVGMELTVVDEKLYIGRVYAKGPAHELGLLPKDRVVRINKRDVGPLGAEKAAALLRGKPGSVVEVEIERSTDAVKPRRVVKLVRRAVAVPSVEHEMLDLAGTPVGYVRISHFQESTLQEVKEALATLLTPDTDLARGPMKGLILDLRGNPGGLFKSAVNVADLFLPGGVIVFTQSSIKEYNRPYKSETVNPLLLPMVVLVDGETASAAEILAGALKETRRAPTLVVGQTTFGKGTIQCIVPVDKAPLDKTPGGIRITIAKFFSPSNQPYSGRGVTPHEVIVEEGEAALEKASALLEKMLKPAMPMPMPTTMASAGMPMPS